MIQRSSLVPRRTSSITHPTDMNSVVILVAAVALAQSVLASYAGAYPGDYGSQGVGGGAYGFGVGSAGVYHGPLARPVVLPSGYLADTADVAAAKDAHLVAVSKTAATAAGAYEGGAYKDGSDDNLWADDGSYSVVGSVGAYGAGAYGDNVYDAAGYGVDAYGVGAYGAGALGAGAYGAGAYGARAYGAGLYGAGQMYADPLAVPVVLPSGYLADTHDVAVAKGAHITAVTNVASRSASYGGSYGGYGGAYGTGYYGRGYYH